MLISSKLILDVSTHHWRIRENGNSYNAFYLPSFLDVHFENEKFGKKNRLQFI